MADPAFWRGRRVLLTGHTGFKGAWAAFWLTEMGAEVTGLALAPETDPALFDILGAQGRSVICDLRDRDRVAAEVAAADPEIVLHMAAQPLVRRSYREPVETFATNVMGTVHLLDALRGADVRAILVVTSDKVYENDESGRAFAEDARLGGHDPYAASKAAAEIAVASYARSYFREAGVPLATARGGNVIGGGDFSEDRLVPDIIRAALTGNVLQLRNPEASRPWQHVLDCLSGYFAYLEGLATGRDLPPSLNFGPHDPADVLTVGAVTAEMCRAMGLPGDWQLDEAPAPHEMAALAIDSTRAGATLGWRGRLTGREAIRLTADWYAAWKNGADMTRVTRDQIAAYQEKAA